MIDPIARRIAIFLEDNSISIKDFTDRLNVQRSSLSHILSGRNKPSLDFILKMLRAYPSLSERWLLHGKGLPHGTESHGTTPLPPSSGTHADTHVTDVIEDLTTTDVTDVTESDIHLTESEVPDNKNSKRDTRLVKVLLLYSDGSFRQYYPSASLQEE